MVEAFAHERLAELREIWFRYSHAPWLLQNCDFHVDAGERILLRGPNGCGKTSLLKMILGQLRPERGSYTHHGDLCTRCALLPQESSLNWDVPVQARDVVASGALSSSKWWWPWPRVSTQRVYEALEMVGLADQASMRPVDMSGGQRRRLLIARTFLQRAHLILMDEPLSGLDSQARQNLAKTLEQVTGAGKAALVITSHEVVDFPIAFDHDLHFLDGRLIPTQDAHCEMDR